MKMWKCKNCSQYSKYYRYCSKCGEQVGGEYDHPDKIIGEDVPKCNQCGRESSDLSMGLCPYCLERPQLKLQSSVPTADWQCSKCKRVFQFPEDTKTGMCGPCNAPAYKVADKINPSHYKSHPSGIECISITRHMSFNIGNAIKYLWRCDLKNGVEDLKKAAWYIQDEIKKER